LTDTPDAPLASRLLPPDVLIVDDDPGTLETFKFILRDADVNVRLAATGAQAVGLARQLPPTLVLCDLNLPDATALDVLREFCRSAIDAPFVIVTGFSTVTSALEAGRLGVVDYLEKPVSAEQLLNIVRAHAHAQSGRRGQRSDPVARSSRTARAKPVIEARYAEPDLNVRAVARALGLSTQHVCRILKQEVGLTFAELLRNVRLREARRLLGDPACGMKEIAHRVGFRHPSQFTRAFRDDCGISPTEYRHRRTKGN